MTAGRRTKGYDLKRLLLICGLALVLTSSAWATTTTSYTISASPSRASIVTWTTTQPGDLTMTLRYSSKSVPAFNVWATTNGSLNGLCTATSGPGWITYSCIGAPASGYEAMIWPLKGGLSGTLTIAGETG